MSNYLLSDNVVFANARMQVDGLTSSQSIPDGVNTQITTWDTNNLILEGGGSFDGTNYIIPADGWYTINASLSFSDTTMNNRLLHAMIWVDGVQTRRGLGHGSATGRLAGVSVDSTIKLSMGQTVSIYVYQLDNGATTLSVNDELSYLSIHRISEYSAGQPVGFGVAQSNNYGLIKYKEGTWSTTFTSISNLDSTPTFTSGTYEKIGSRVFFEFRASVDVTGTTPDWIASFPVADLPYVPTSSLDVQGIGYRENSGASATNGKINGTGAAPTTIQISGNSNSGSLGTWTFSGSYRTSD